MVEKKLSIVFAGGGCRTFWALGAFTQIESLLPEIKEWAGVSAGTAMATVCATGRVRETVDLFKILTADNRRNIYPVNLFRKQPIFPHEGIYRRAVSNVLADKGFDLLNQGAPVRFLLAYIKPGAPRLRTLSRAIKAYRQRKKSNVVHGPAEPLPGMAFEVATAQDAKSRGEIADLIVASSATWPMTNVPIVDGRVYVDGSLVDNVPIRALSPEARSGKTLVLLTRPIPEDLLSQGNSTHYLAPTEKLPITVWDYTSPDKIQEAFEQGLRDARRATATLEAFLAKGW